MAEQETKEDVREAWWWEAEKRRSKPLDYLRKAIWSKGTVGGQYLPGIQVGLDRVYWFTKSFKETDGMPWVERRARAFNTVLEKQPIYIIDHQKIVGYQSARPHELSWQLEGGFLFAEDAFFDTAGLMPEEEKWWIKDCLDYWRPRGFQAQCERYLSEEEQAGMRSGPGASGISLDGSNSAVFDYEFVLENGLNNIAKEIDEKIDEGERLLCSGPSTPATVDVHEKLDQWRAMALTIPGVIGWANRYSRLAKIIAENFETDSIRKAELMKISDICAKVPANPAEHFHEALQAEWFVALAARWIERFHGGWSEREDQVFWPYFKKDVVDEKTLTKDEAIELLAEKHMRIYELSPVAPRGFRAGFQGSPIFVPAITIGGVDENGSDACNDLTDAILQACRLIRVGEPSFMFRYHPGARIQTQRECFETLRHGLGFPSFQHEGVSMDILMHNYGATLEEARSYANVVCMSPGITKGRGGQGVRFAAGFAINYKSYELAFYDGFDFSVSKLQLGPHTGDPTTFKTFEEFYEAWTMQVRYLYEILCRQRTKGRYMEAKWFQQPFGSCMYRRCIDSGMDMTDARCEPVSNAWITSVSLTDMCDSMYALKKLVYDEKKYTMEQLVEAMKANWLGYAEMRQEFLNVPKFGNDIEECDAMASRMFKTVAEECGRNVEWGGGRFMTLPEHTSGWNVAGPFIGALPNGRRLGDNLYDGGVSPGCGFDKKGPTAVLRSVSKIDGRRMKQMLLNQRLSPTQLSGEKGFQLWMNYMKTWYDLNIPHVQFNMVDNETLRAAQREPEKYQELIVRVAGYSAHFVELNALTQEGIIERTVQEI